jgi:hypothetical protein
MRLSRALLRASADVPWSEGRQDLRMYWDHMNGWGWLMMIVWSLIWIGLLGVIAWLAVQWTRTLAGQTTERALRQDSAGVAGRTAGAGRDRFGRVRAALRRA